MVMIKQVAIMIVISKYDVIGCIVYTDEVMNGTYIVLKGFLLGFPYYILGQGEGF
jgi:hypothetical protein